MENGYERKVYNCFINVAAREDTIQMRERDFYSMDIFPTTLSALGVKIEGEHLGLGTNAFSNVPTLAEKYEKEEFNEELSKYSIYYYDNFIISEQ